MTLQSVLDTRSAGYTEAAEAMSAKLADLAAEHSKALAGGGEKYVSRHHSRGKMTSRERVEALLDPDSPFLELSPLAAWGTNFTVGASVVVGIGAFVKIVKSPVSTVNVQLHEFARRIIVSHGAFDVSLKLVAEVSRRFRLDAVWARETFMTAAAENEFVELFDV